MIFNLKILSCEFSSNVVRLTSIETVLGLLLLRLSSLLVLYFYLFDISKFASFSEDSEDFIFRPISFRSSNGSYRFRGSVPLSYSRAREIVLCAFEAIGLYRRDYGLHSLRAGGASATANAQVSDRLFKRHGRWKSDKAKDGYIKDNILSLLSVSLALGI